MKFPETLKKTKARETLFDYFNEHAEPVSVDKLHELFSDIHIATLYRMVDEFSKAGLIRLSDDFNPRSRHYELNRLLHHHKIKCVECHQEIMLESCPLHLEVPDGFVVLDHPIEIEGLCKKCAGSRKQK